MIRLYFGQVLSAVRTAFADRGNFALQLVGMIVNDVFFLALWALFFAGFRSVGGWTLADTALLISLMMIVFGASGVLFGGYRDLAGLFLRGDLDALLTQPKPLLPQLLAKESSASGWGDILAGAVVLGFADLGWTDLPLLAFGLVTGLTIYLSAAISFACMAFWLAGARSLARDMTDWMVLFGSNPGAMLSPATKLLAFTVLPAGFVVALPVELLREPKLSTLAAIAGGVVGWAALAWLLFVLGVRRYRRGEAPVG